MSDNSKILADASKAKLILEDELFQSIFQAMKEHYYTKWLYTLPEEHDKRERFWQAIHILELVKDHLNGFVQNGKLTQAETDQIAYLKSHT